MGAAPCLIIINEGNLAYAATEIFAKNHPMETSYLEATIQASCNSIHHTSLYFEMGEEEVEIPDEITQPIIDLHKEIIHRLALDQTNITQSDINHMAIRLMRATRKLYTLFGVTIESLDLIKLTDLIT